MMLARLSPIYVALALALPTAAQTLPDLDKRVTKLERQVDRVSRRVLPKGEQTMIAPEVSTEAGSPPTVPPPTPASASSVADLTERLSAVERRQGEITNSLEEQGNRLKIAEDRLTKFQADTEARLVKLEGGATVPPASASGAAATPAPAPSPAPAPIDPPPATKTEPASPPTTGTADSQFAESIALYQAKKWPEAQTGFQAFVDKHPKDKRLSEARYWLARADYNNGDFDPAARAAFQNYNDNPKGDHAQESLFWVGKSLIRLQRNKQACQVFEVADQRYATTMKPELRPQFAAQRKIAGCR